MSAPHFNDIRNRIDKHFEKTGVVLVGMHQELQEQKHRIGQYQKKVDVVTSDLSRRQDEILADLRTRAEAAVAVLDEVDPLMQRVRSVAQDAGDAIQSAGEVLQTSTNNLSLSHTDFRTEAEKLLGRVDRTIASFSSESKDLIDRFAAQQAKALEGLQSEATEQRSRFRSDNVALISTIRNQIASFSSETENLLKQFSKQQDRSITASSNENRLALQGLVTEQARFLANAQNTFRESITKLEDKFSAKMDVYKSLLKSSYDELSERQRASDDAFVALKAEIERFQSQQIAFSKKTRLIIGMLVVAGLAVLAVLAYGKGVIL